MTDIAVFKNSDLALIRKTVAKDCLPHEFDQYIHIARAVGLDPLRRQIYAFVFGKGGKEEDRKLTIVTAIDGYRSISARSGDYRPADKPTLYEYDAALKSPSNPHGILRAEVTLYKWSHGDWHSVIGEAFWDEFVPLNYSPTDIIWHDTGKKYKDGNPVMKKVVKEGAVPTIDPDKTGWVKGPRNQISKCAEAQAHRKGWPNDFSGVYVQEEIDRLQTLDLTASEIADFAEKEDRIARLGGPDQYIVDWLDGGELQAVHGGKFADQVLAFIAANKEEPSTIAVWRQRNKHSFNQFWGAHKGEALELKAALEKAEATEAMAYALGD